MQLDRFWVWSARACRAALVGTTLFTSAFAAAAADTTHLKVVGGLGSVAQYKDVEEPFWSKELPALTKGRVTVGIVPFDRAGIRASEMLRLLQVGAVPLGSVILARQSDPLLAAADLTGLNPDYASLKRNFQAYRPMIEQALREHHGVEPLMLYPYPAQILFCKNKFSGLQDLAGRRIRVSDSSQADMVRAFHATAVQTEFNEIVTGVQQGNLDCAITGGMSGNAIGLHEVTTHLSDRAFNWGIVAFCANAAAWRSMSPALKQILQAELPKVEAKAWELSRQLVTEGVACNVGASGCASGRRGHMTLVRESDADLKARKDMFSQVILDNWVNRCGEACQTAWKRHMAPLTGIETRLR